MTNEQRDTVQALVDALATYKGTDLWCLPSKEALARGRALLAQAQEAQYGTIAERAQRGLEAGWWTAAAAQPAQPPADGWVCVPKTLTLQMMAAAGPAIRACYGLDGKNGYITDVWAAMLAAAPQPPAREPASDEQIEDLRGEANRGMDIDRDDYFKAFRDAEFIHGIGNKT